MQTKPQKNWTPDQVRGPDCFGLQVMASIEHLRTNDPGVAKLENYQIFFSSGFGS